MATNGSDSGVVSAIDTTQEQEFSPYDTLMQAAAEAQAAEAQAAEQEPEVDYNKPLTDGQDGYAVFHSMSAAESAMGYGNGGEADQWQQKLTQNQLHGLQSYTGTGYHSMNDWLRGETGYISDVMRARARSLQHALDKYTLQAPTVTHRGTGPEVLGLPAGASPQEIVTVVKALISSGGRITDKGFTSSAVNESSKFDKPVIIHAQTPAGKGIGAFVSGVSSVGKGESEFLYNSGSHFTPLGVYMVGNTVHINVRYDGRDKSTNIKKN